MAAIEDWARLDITLRGLFVELVHGDPTSTAAVYSALTGSNAQRAAFDALASTALPGPHKEAFDAVNALVASVQKERNRIAHWAWGLDEGISDGVLLIDPDAFMTDHVADKAHSYAMEKYHDGKRLAPSEFPFPRWAFKTLVYFASDFEMISKRINRANQLAIMFRDTLKSQDQQLLDPLLAEREIAEFLSRRRKNQQD